MSENFDSKESEPPNLSHISLEQGKVLVGRIDSCFKQNPDTDLVIFVDFGAAPLETVVRELDPNLTIEHLKLDANLVRTLANLSQHDLKRSIGADNADFLQKITADKKHIVLIDDVEHTGATLQLAQNLFRSFNPDCSVIKFSIIKSSESIMPGSDEWPFAQLDDSGLVKRLKMPWEDNQDKFVGREVDKRANMRTVPSRNLHPLSLSLKQDIQAVLKYFK